MNRYSDIPIRTLPSGRKIYNGVKYPEIPFRDTDFYVITQEGDRYDLYANQYYRDFSLWWIIPLANPSLSLNSIYPPLGAQIRIPADIPQIISDYNLLNQ